MKKAIFTALFFTQILRGGILTAQVNLTESNLPIITVNTNGRVVLDNPKIAATMRIVQNPSGTTRPTDSANVYFGKIGIELRGSTSQSISAKKPYAVELQDENGEENEKALFGWTKEADWALIAPYSDKTLMRDALTYHLASKLMKYAPKTKFCELVLNNEYQGVYVLTETVKRKRLGISKMDSTSISDDALTGGYILKIDKSTGNPTGVNTGFSSNFVETGAKGPTFFQYHYPKPEDIKPVQAAYIQTQVREFEKALNSNNYNSPTEGYAKFIDVNSFIDFWIMNEITRNVDGYRLSTYFHKDKNSVNSKFVMGPVWDFNIALGNANYCSGGDRTGWAYQFNQVCPSDGWTVPFWWGVLLGDKNFRKQVKTRWTEWRKTELKTEKIIGVIDSFSMLLEKPQERNFTKWNILKTWIWPNAQVNQNYYNEVLYLKDWLDSRLRWLDGEISAFQVAEHPINPFDFEVFPNPSVSDSPVRFAYYLTADAKVDCQIFDLSGRTIFQKEMQQTKGDNEFTVSEKFQKGIFIYKIFRNGGLWKQGKLVKI